MFQVHQFSIEEASRDLPLVSRHAASALRGNDSSVLPWAVQLPRAGTANDRLRRIISLRLLLRAKNRIHKIQARPRRISCANRGRQSIHVYGPMFLLWVLFELARKRNIPLSGDNCRTRERPDTDKERHVHRFATRCKNPTRSRPQQGRLVDYQESAHWDHHPHGRPVHVRALHPGVLDIYDREPDIRLLYPDGVFRHDIRHRREANGVLPGPKLQVVLERLLQREQRVQLAIQYGVLRRH